ncbi:MAG: hypothetical protein LBS90_08655 [Oscillospiraceae bacterium]|jgi:hypothetical protein|nr:hypothetical protein [Oscillospiraceae bacterium]
MYIVLGIICGLVIGAAELALLSRYCLAVTSGKLTGGGVLLLIAFLFLPLAAFTLIALLLLPALVWTGSVAGGLIALGGIALFMRLRRG